VGTYRNNGLYEVNPNVVLTIDRMLERLRLVPRTVSVAAATRPPVQGAIGMNFRIEGAPQSDVAGPPPNAAYIGITPNYFATLKTPVLRGRDFTGRDTEAAPHVAIINETLAKRYWPNENPLGQRITIDYLPNDTPREIVAVVGDTRLSRAQQVAPPIMYVPLAQQGPQWIGPQLGERAGAYFVMRAAEDPMGLIPAARLAVAEIDRSQPVANIQTIEQALSDQVQYTRLYVLLLAVFGGSAALLAAIGIYGVMAYSIAQRRHEIGLRMALGASASDVLQLVGRQAIVMISLGLLLGLAGSFALTRILESALWNVTPTDPLNFTMVSLLLALVAVAACIVPARQAARVDPTVALRND
jgi:putative ABC transport system permease protein